MFIELLNPNGTPFSIEHSLIKYVSVVTVQTEEGSKIGSVFTATGVGNLMTLTSYEEIMRFLLPRKKAKTSARVLKLEKKEP
jgi:hypothetical protein